VLPTAWQGVEYADIPEGGTLAVFGLGPIAFRHALGVLLLGLVSAGLLRLGRHRDGWRHITGRW
jgi:hypothetical protein